MFLGEYSPNMTEGSRIALPKKIREQINSESVVLTKGFEKCIYIYDKEDWQEQAEKQIENSKQDVKNAKIRDLERYLYASATEASVDTQGRLVLPANLLEYAGITSRTAVVGVGNRVEVWGYKKWKDHMNKISEDLSE
ncbi:division/cell wall cluster transcriptional repressor MraZ [Patescibacteria group bacterium]